MPTSLPPASAVAYKQQGAEPAPGTHLRTIARALEQYLLRSPDSSVHWISVIGEDNLEPVPKLMWDAVLADSLLQVSVAQGFSEGMLLYVHAQRDRYKPGNVRALFRVKLLCGPHRAFQEASAVWLFFNSTEFESLVSPKTV